MLLDPVERLDDGRLLLRRIAKCVAVEIGTGQFREVLHRLARRRKAADADVHHVLERDVARPRHVEPEHGIVAQAHVVKADRQHHHGHRRDRAGIGFDGVACSCDLAAFRRGERMIEPPADLHLRPFLGGAGCGVIGRHEDGMRRTGSGVAATAPCTASTRAAAAIPILNSILSPPEETPAAARRAARSARPRSPICRSRQPSCTPRNSFRCCATRTCPTSCRSAPPRSPWRRASRCRDPAPRN